MNESNEEIMQEFLEHEKIRFEGQAGLRGLNKISNALGYKEDSYLYGSSFERFLQDNSGCVQTIIEWITEHLSNEQRENMESFLPEKID